MLKRLIRAGADRLGYTIARKGGAEPWGVDYVEDIRRILRDEQFALPHRSLRTIFDVGANVGQSAIRFATAFPGSAVTAFEPVAETFAQLERNTAPYPSITPFQIGLGSRAETRPIYLYQGSVLSSCLAETPVMAARGPAFLGSATVRLTTLDAFCAERGTQQIDLLKVDTEGFDHEVLLGAAGLLQERRVTFVAFEFFLVGDDQPSAGGRLLEINRQLVGHGYRSVAFYTDFVNPRVNVGIYNALYMRWDG